MTRKDSGEEVSESVLSRRELLGASATLGTAAIASATGGVGSAFAKNSTEPRIGLGDDYNVYDDPNGNGDLVIKHEPSGNTFTYDASVGEWTAGTIKSNQVNAGEATVDNIGAFAYMSADQTITSGTTTKIQLDSTKYDDRGELDSTNHKIVVEVAGKYNISASLGWKSDTGWSTGDRINIRIIVNGAVVVSNDTGKVGTSFQSQSSSIQLQLSAGDEVELHARQQSGADKVVDSNDVVSYVTFGRRG